MLHFVDVGGKFNVENNADVSEQASLKIGARLRQIGIPVTTEK
jgi:hypothetical protein